MTATLVETYEVVVAEIVQTKYSKDELSFSRFYGMMSYADYVVFEYEVQNGLRSINDTFEISK